MADVRIHVRQSPTSSPQRSPPSSPVKVNPSPKKKTRIEKCLSISYHSIAILGITIALTLSTTMLYILWIGFYPPSEALNRVFFIDRLQDFRELIDGLRNGKIMDAFTQAIISSMAQSMEKYINEHSKKASDVPVM